MGRSIPRNPRITRRDERASTTCSTIELGIAKPRPFETSAARAHSIDADDATEIDERPPLLGDGRIRWMKLAVASADRAG
jgi:hypothetical protein